MLLLAGLLVAVGGISFACAQSHKRINFSQFLRKTFAPLTVREFWLPPCPFCWAMRGLAVAMLAVAIL